ncbi:MAG: hypothetical protein AABX00_05650 [Nanoarchaeota archaeon]
MKDIFGNTIKTDIFGNKPPRPTASCPKTIRDQLRVKWWKGNYGGTCFCCGRKLSWEHHEAGRIKAGGRYTVPNTRLICKTCNRGMGKQNLKIYMKRNFLDRYNKYFPKTEKSKKSIRKKIKKNENQWGIKPINLPKF